MFNHFKGVIQWFFQTLIAYFSPYFQHHEIKIKDNEFLPHAITIKRGDYVWWKWNNAKLTKSVKQVITGLEITKKNHCDGDVFEHSFKA